MYCFAVNRVADLLKEFLHDILVRAGQVKVYNTLSWDPDDERGIDYYTAGIIRDATKA
jgi:hypothetical protein